MVLPAIAAAAGGLIGKGLDLWGQSKQEKLQKQFAKQGIQWKVADAKKAGIHPLYALGANTISYQPTSVGSSSADFANIGQNVGRAIDATRSNGARAEAIAVTAGQLQNEGLRLDNELKRTQLASAIATTRPTGGTPGLPSPYTMPAATGMPGQGDTPHIDGPKIELERKVSPAAPGAPHAEYGDNPDVTFVKTDRGTWTPVMPQALAESFEQDWLGGLRWQIRNTFNPKKPPPHPLPKGYEWSYHLPSAQWEMRPILNRGSGKFRRY